APDLRLGQGRYGLAPVPYGERLVEQRAIVRGDLDWGQPRRLAGTPDQLPRPTATGAPVGLGRARRSRAEQPRMKCAILSEGLGAPAVQHARGTAGEQRAPRQSKSLMVQTPSSLSSVTV